MRGGEREGVKEARRKKNKVERRRRGKMALYPLNPQPEAAPIAMGSQQH